MYGKHGHRPRLGLGGQARVCKGLGPSLGLGGQSMGIAEHGQHHHADSQQVRGTAGAASGKSAAIHGSLPRGRSARKTRRRERERFFFLLFFSPRVRFLLHDFLLLPHVKIPLSVLF